jgi:hypothetical protein
MSQRITSSCESNGAWSSALLKGNLLGTRKATGQKLAGGHRTRIGILSRSGKSLHCAKNFGHALRVIGEQHRNLGAHNRLVRASPCGPLLTGNRTPTSLKNKLIEVLASHELHDLLAQSQLPGTKLLELGLKDTRFII